MSNAAIIFCVDALSPHLFSLRYIGGVAGVVFVVAVIGSALGPVIFGLAFDTIG
jgi:hypothetical protein